MRILKHKLTAGNTTDLTSVARYHHICMSIFHSVIDPRCFWNTSFRKWFERISCECRIQTVEGSRAAAALPDLDGSSVSSLLRRIWCISPTLHTKLEGFRWSDKTKLDFSFLWQSVNCFLLVNDCNHTVVLRKSRHNKYNDWVSKKVPSTATSLLYG